MSKRFRQIVKHDEKDLANAIQDTMAMMQEGNTVGHSAKVIAEKYQMNHKTIGTYAGAVQSYIDSGRRYNHSAFTGNLKLRRIAKKLHQEHGDYKAQQDEVSTKKYTTGNPIDKIVQANELFAEGVEGLMQHFDKMEAENKELREQIAELSSHENEKMIGGRLEKLSKRFALTLGR